MAEFDRNAPSTKGDLQDLKDELIEAIRDNQTEVLKAFYNFAESNNKRLAQNEVNETALRSRVDTLERRLLEVEKRLNIPPAA
ncbi:MAG TPA: hypothetical protein VN736_26970 [Candidatus Limnocylindrales bacterium]|nr:hypothetical protein [Candidatus Limnocylindrales bacterium]